MKKIIGFISCAAAAALGFSACTAEDLKNDNENVSKTVTVHFGTENTDPASTKATLTPDEGETAFQAAWEENDEISISYSLDFADPSLTTGKWNGSSFEATIPGENGDWMYDAAYPVPDAKDSHVDFGPNRTQKGNIYNSLYDIMIGSAVAENADAGKDASGKDIVFQMERQTAIAYFHFTSDLDEAITKATLTVSGEGAAIASDYAYFSNFVWAHNKDCQSITITFPEEAPNAKDFQLWFNVLPTEYESMTLTVETATKTFTISKASSGVYEKGKLYKVKKENISWTTIPTTIFFYESFDKTTGTGGNDDKWSGSIASSLVSYDKEGWTVSNEGGAYQCIKLGSGKNQGSATTPALGITAKSASLWFKAAAWDGTSEGTRLKISISGDDASITPESITLEKGKWSEYVCTITGADATSKVTIEAANNTNNRFFLDEVYVYSGPKPEFYSVNFASVEGGAFSASQTSAKEGTEITLTATPDEGYEFRNDWVVKDTDDVEITVTDGKFTMPAKDVTVSGSFSKVDYTITKETCEGGSFTVKKDGVEVTKAQIGETIILEASAAEGYEFDSWTVTSESTSKTVYVSGNTFTMPGANVTVKANFVELAVVPVYASLTELVNAGAPTSTETYVTVTLTKDEITGIYTSSKGYRNGIYFMVGTQEIEIYCQNVPEDWIIGGYVSGTLANCAWKLFGTTWELCPTDWTELTYAAPCETPVITLNDAEASITCATEGAIVRYTLDETDPTESSEVYSAPVTLTDGQTIKAKAFLAGHKSSEVASKTYSSSSEGTKYYIKVTSESEIVDGGKYLIVHNSKVATKFANSGLSLEEISISDDKITSSETIDQYAITIKSGTNGYSLLLGSSFIGYSSSSNLQSATSISSSSTTKYYWTFSVQSDGTFLIKNVSSDTRYLGVNATGTSIKAYSTDNVSKYPQPVLYKLSE